MAEVQSKAKRKPRLKVRVKFMGDLPAVIGARSLELKMQAGSTVGDLLAALSKAHGEAFTARVFATPTKLHHYMLIFVDGEHLKPRETLDAPLGSEIDVVMLPMFGGG